MTAEYNRAAVADLVADYSAVAYSGKCIRTVAGMPSSRVRYSPVRGAFAAPTF